MALGGLLLALATACERPLARVPAVGDPVPAYTATTLQGEPVSLEAMTGQPVLLNLWATWCHPCREEMPDLQRLHQTYGPRGLRVIGVSIDAPGAAGDIPAFLREFGVGYPIWLDPDDRASSLFGVPGIPATFLIGADGTLLWKHLGPVESTDPGLQRGIEAALSPSG